MVETLYLSPKWDRRGSALWVVANLLAYFEGVRLKTYSGEKHGCLLSYNTLPKHHSSMRKVVLVGGFRLKDNGIPRNNAWNKIGHVVFNSEFYQKITLSKYKIKHNSVLHILGGAPSEKGMFAPVEKRDSIQNKIHFLICAKWHKRSFKRLKQSLYLFNNFILDKYPKSKLHVLGNNIKEEKIQKKNVYFYRRTFHRNTVPDTYRKANIQLVLTPFDSGPLTLGESLHYRVPFVCSRNCCGPEFIKLIDGLCGEAVEIDPFIDSAKDCRKYRPITNRKFYDKPIDYCLIMNTIDRIVNDYSKYITWKWTETFNYLAQSKKWMEILFG